MLAPILAYSGLRQTRIPPYPLQPNPSDEKALLPLSFEQDQPEPRNPPPASFSCGSLLRRDNANYLSGLYYVGFSWCEGRK